MSKKQNFRKEHVHYKPELYVGSFNEVQEQHWIIQNQKLVLKTITYVPAVLKLCEELLINVTQQKMRNPNIVNIQINAKQNGMICVINDGCIWLDKLFPSAQELQTIFGEEQMNSELYDRHRGGKLVNMYSRSFFVETGNNQSGQAIKVQWRDNMTVVQAPRIVPYDKRDYTKIQSTLDLQKLRITKFSPEFIGLLERRAWDIAALQNVQIIFNGKTIKFQNLQEYASLFMKGAVLFKQEGTGWTVIMGPSEHGYQQLSFVNGCIWTRSGGTHVNNIIAQIANKGLQLHHKRLRDPNEVMLNANRFTSNFMLFVNFTIEQPKFRSVMRDSLTNQKLTHAFHISQAAIQFLQSKGALQAYKDMVRQRDHNKQRSDTLNTDKSTLSRLEDADKAGDSTRCTLIIVENDATRHLLAIGLECVNRQYFGIYTLKGKPPNARQLKHPLQNHDFAAISKALGLPSQAQNIHLLRYSCVLIVTDQGMQGVAIKGLLLNFFETVYPWLLRSQGFIKLLIPPVIRCANALGNVREFLSDRDYRSWISLNSLNEWTPTFFRNIGSMDPNHMRDLFADRKKYCFSVIYQSPLDQNALSLPYSNDIEARRKWLQEHRPQSVLDYNINSKAVSLRQFVDRQLAHFFYFEATRHLPSVVDGLTTTQRRIISCMMKQKEGEELKVDKLVGLVLQQSINEEGEAVRKGIITMGRSYVGSNNLALIEGIGQFGSRLAGGKDHAPSRHLRAALSSFTRLIFPAEDEGLVNYQSQEPIHYVPIVPLILINGFNFPGTIWKSVVLPHKVLDVIEAIKVRLAKNSGKVSIIPGWEGFKGSVEQQKNTYIVQGLYEMRCTRTAIIKQNLPLQAIKDYRIFLQSKDEIVNVKEEQKGDNCLLVVRFKQGRMPKDIQNYLQLSSALQDSPSMLISSTSKPKKYQSLGDIFEDYLQTRLKMYEKRKDVILSKLIRSIELANQKIRFMRDILARQFQPTESEETWRLKFIRKGYKRYQDLTKIPGSIQTYRDFQYLEKMPLTQVSQRKIANLRAEYTQSEEKLALLKKTTEKDMWLKDLAMFQDRWKKVIRQREQIVIDSLRRAENCYHKQPSDQSINHQKAAIEFDQISLDSKAREDQQRSKTQELSQEEPPNSKIKQTNIKKARPTESRVRLETKTGELSTDIAKAEFMAQRKNFQMQIKQMERKNYDFQQRMRREAESCKKEVDRTKKLDLLEKHRLRQAQRAKKQTQQKQKLQEIRDRQQKIAKEKADKANIQKQACIRRDILGRHAMQIGKKVQEDKKRQQQQRDKSQKSNRNHLPAAANGAFPKITVPYHCDSGTFQVNHVERKRFSSRDIKIDQAQINRIHADIKRKQQQDEQRANNNRHNTCIELDDD